MRTPRPCAPQLPGPLRLKAEDFVVASTGVIGQTLNIQAIQSGMPKAGRGAVRRRLRTAQQRGHHDHGYRAQIQPQSTLDFGGKPVTIGAIAKGSGMIHPNMGTMLCLCHHRLRHQPGHAAGCPPGDRGPDLQPGDSGWRYLHQRHVRGAGQRHGGQPADRVEGRELSGVLMPRWSRCAALWPESIAADGEGASRLITCTGAGRPQ